MADIKVVTEVAGRICALPVNAGASISEGDDVAFVEAMKMEIPVAAPAIANALASATGKRLRSLPLTA